MDRKQLNEIIERTLQSFAETYKCIDSGLEKANLDFCVITYLDKMVAIEPLREHYFQTYIQMRGEDESPVP